MAQQRAPRFATETQKRLKDMLNNLKWKTQDIEGLKLQLTVLFKMIHDLIDIPPSDYLTRTSSRTRKSNSHKYLQYFTSTDCFKNSFCFRTILVLKRLPSTVAEAPSLALFKRELSILTFEWGISPDHYPHPMMSVEHQN